MGDPIGNVPWQRLIHGAYKMCGAASPTIVSSSATRTNRQQQGHHCRQQGLIGHHRVRPLYRDQLTIRRLEDLHLLQEEVRSQSAATAHFSRHLYCLWNKPRQQGLINQSIDCYSRVSPCQKGHQQWDYYHRVRPLLMASMGQCGCWATGYHSGIDRMHIQSCCCCVSPSNGINTIITIV